MPVGKTDTDFAPTTEDTMKRILTLSILVLAIPAFVLAATPKLPDYEKEARLVGTVVCDAGKTSVQFYKSSKYDIVVVTVGNGTIYYHLGTNSEETFFMKKTGSAEVQSMSSEAVKKALKEDAPNFRASLNSNKHDCKMSQ